MNKTPIEWTDFTVNPFRFRNLETGKVGHHCDKISAGCKNCYSSAMQAGPYLSGLTFIEENKPKGEFFLDDSVLQQVLRRRKPCRIFWCDMTDMFLSDYPEEWIDRCFAVMALTPHLTHQILTKRADRMREYCANPLRGEIINQQIHRWHEAGMPGAAPGVSYYRVNKSWPHYHVWLGVSVEDQQRKSRIDILRVTPAAVRFVSFEPLLEDLGDLDLSGIGLAIWGGESGPGARPCNTEWIRGGMQHARRDGCRNFVKQLGAHVIQGGGRRIKADKKGGDMDEWEHDLRVRQMPEGIGE